MPKYFFYLLTGFIAVLVLLSAGYWLESAKGIKIITAEYTPIITGSLFFIIWVLFVGLILTILKRRSDISKFLTFMTVEKVQSFFIMGRRYFGRYNDRSVEIFYRPAMRNSPARLEVRTPVFMPSKAVFYSSRFLFQKTGLENCVPVDLGGKKIRVKADGQAGADRLLSLSTLRGALELFTGITPRFGHFILWIDRSSVFLKVSGMRIKLDRIGETVSCLCRLDKKT
ncbi:hypothetical protein JXL83_08920 [candidate division WOR-3 bacterium]|nr:hypothetical protein [candidate division WOR-3 bacterium]